MKNIYFVVLTLLIFQSTTAQVFTGQVIDKSTKNPIAYAQVYFPELKAGTVTNNKGEFKLEHHTPKKLHIQISYVGYQSIDETINTDTDKKQLFYLTKSHYQLKEVVVSVPDGKLQGDNVVSVDHKKIDNLQRTAPITLAEAISSIPGIDQNTTGAGIGKPVIRGLTGNRIVTYAQGIRVENQQWGDEHGLGVGEVGIESVEVIKGPASLLYGADAMGGVLFFIDERYANENTIEAKAKTSFLSNTLGSINQLGFKIHKGSLKLNLFGAYSSQADYKVPNGKRVFNSRFDEKNFKLALGFNTKNLVSNLRYSYLENNFGIVDSNLYDESRDRNFELPFQNIVNHSVSLQNTLYTGDSKTNLTLGYTHNYRQEFEDQINPPALGLELGSFTYNLNWHSPVYKNIFDFVVGSQGMIQTNFNNGDEVLIPDAESKDFGAFGLLNIDLDKLTFQTGIRFDHRKIDTKTTRHIQEFSHNYQGITYSAGAVYRLHKFKLRANVSSGFRAPTSSELLSDGVHEGTIRYEKGNRDLNNENATQLDFSVDYQNKHFHFTINPFYNYIQNYIYLSPTGQQIGKDDVYEYLQTDAYLYGGELGFHYHPHFWHRLHIQSSLATVFAEDVHKNALPLIPQSNTNTTLSIELNTRKKINLSRIFVQHIYKFEQNHTGLFETISPEYQLVNTGVSFLINTKQKPIEIETGVRNVFNTRYIDHLSRFKTMDISNQGINFYISLKIDITKNI